VTTTARVVAALIALIAWTGLAIQFYATHTIYGSVLSTVWVLVWYFTITTNLLVAIVFTGIAANRFTAPSTIAGTTLFIVLVGVVYGLLLHGLRELSANSAIANVLLHMVTPVLAPLFWLAFVPKGTLRRSAPLVWATYPLGYLFYALIRGEFTDRYPYPFINVAQLGWGRTLLNALSISICFLLAGWGLVLADRLLGRSSSGDGVEYASENVEPS
jgi:hypothetical protein